MTVSAPMIAPASIVDLLTEMDTVTKDGAVDLAPLLEVDIVPEDGTDQFNALLDRTVAADDAVFEAGTFMNLAVLADHHHPFETGIVALRFLAEIDLAPRLPPVHRY